MQPMINTLLDPVVNFGKTTVSTGYTDIDTVIVLTAGHGSKLPNPSTDGNFNIVWFDASIYTDPSDDPNVEIVRCTSRSGDVLTIIRGQEGTLASNKNTPTKVYNMILSTTKKTITDIKAEYQSGVASHAIVTTSVHNFDSSGNAPAQTHNNTRHSETYLTSADNIVARSLKSTTTTIDVSTTPAPSSGQVLTATSGTNATWQYITVGIIPTGGILPYAGATAPSGFLLCDGAAISRTTYATLYSVIGTIYGTGDGSTTFNVPNFLGRVIVGAGSGSGLTTRTRGDKAGEETHVLTVPELAAHTHLDYSGSSGTGGFPHNSNDSSQITNVTSSTGSNTAHNNMPPFGVANYIIKT